jgi:hypothetical protein
MNRPYEGKSDSNLEKTLTPGESLPWSFENYPPLEAGTVTDIQQGAKRLYVLGRIRYVDDLGISRETAFCRRYAPADDRFVPVIDPDYEYVD